MAEQLGFLAKTLRSVLLGFGVTPRSWIPTFDDLFNALHEWALAQNFNFRLYKSRDMYVTRNSNELKVEPDDSYASRLEYIFNE